MKNKIDKIILPQSLLNYLEKSIIRIDDKFFQLNLDDFISLIKNDKKLSNRIVKLMESSIKNIPFFFRGIVRDKIKDFLTK